MLPILNLCFGLGLGVGLDLFGKRIGVLGKEIGRWETKWMVYENDALLNSGAC
jgi:hypothetical protein